MTVLLSQYEHLLSQYDPLLSQYDHLLLSQYDHLLGQYYHLLFNYKVLIADYGPRMARHWNRMLQRAAVLIPSRQGLGELPSLASDYRRQVVGFQPSRAQTPMISRRGT
jgi:hypothetical protein